jgi:hypothetical protein
VGLNFILYTLILYPSENRISLVAKKQKQRRKRGSIPRWFTCLIKRAKFIDMLEETKD